MATDLSRQSDPAVDPPAHLPINELKTRLWAMSYEPATNVVCCENCGTTTSVTRLVANPDALPERRRKNDAAMQGPDQCCIKASGPDKSYLEGSWIDDRYAIVGKLGEGGMGSVYLVHDKILDKQMAIKMLRGGLAPAGDTPLARRFEQEARSALDMTHVNVVAAYCQGRHSDGAPYLVMDYIEGESLAKLIQRQGVLEIHHALGIFMQVCEALTHAHTKNLIHRDIKPANVLLRPLEGGGELVKLVDFGIAKTLPLFEYETLALTQTSEILGSPAYMSPEHCLGEQVDERSDIYSLGCVMFEALTGLPPFTARHPIKAIMQHLKTAPPPLARRVRIDDQPTMEQDFDFQTYRQAVEEVVWRCLAKDPADRYQTADALRLDLEALSKNLVPGLSCITGLSGGPWGGQESKVVRLSGQLPAGGRQNHERGSLEAAVTLVVLSLILIAIWIARAL